MKWLVLGTDNRDVTVTERTQAGVGQQANEAGVDGEKVENNRYLHHSLLKDVDIVLDNG